jgi:hypothetical protein
VKGALRGSYYCRHRRFGTIGFIQSDGFVSLAIYAMT